MTWQLSILLVAGCGFFNAVADTLQHHFFTSVFRKKKQSFWNPNVIVKTCKQIFGYPIDAWHLAGSAEVVLWLLLATNHQVVINWWADLIIGGCIYNATFNLFYNKIFYKK